MVSKVRIIWKQVAATERQVTIARAATKQAQELELQARRALDQADTRHRTTATLHETEITTLTDAVQTAQTQLRSSVEAADREGARYRSQAVQMKEQVAAATKVAEESKLRLARSSRELAASEDRNHKLSEQLQVRALFFLYM